MVKSRISKAALIFTAVCAAAPGVKAANYYVDPNYAGVNGAPYGIYTAAYSNIASALGAVAGVTGVPAGSAPVPEPPGCPYTSSAPAGSRSKY